MLTLEVGGIGALQLAVTDVRRVPGRQWLPGTVHASEFLGEFTRYHVRVGEQRVAVEEAHQADAPRLPPASRWRWGSTRRRCGCLRPDGLPVAHHADQTQASE